MLQTLLLTGILLTQAPAPAQTGTVAGTIRSADAGPAARVRVVAVEAQDANAAETGTAAIVSLTQTDGAGRYRLENVPAGRYYIMAGFLDSPSYFPGVAFVTGARVVTVTAGSVAERVDFAMVRSAGLKVSGRVVRDPRQRQAAEVSIRMTRAGGAQRGALETPVAADGSFEFTAVPPGTYNARVFPGDAYYSAAIVEVGDKDIANLSFEVPFTVDVALRLVTEGPFPRVGIAFTDQTGRVRRPPPGPPALDFRVQLPEGAYTIELTDIPLGYQVESITQQAIDLLRQPLRVAAGSSPEVTIRLRAPSPLPGVKVSGRVSGAQVRAVRLSGPSVFLGYETPVNASGVFEFSQVLPGNYRVSYDPNVSPLVRSIAVGDKDVTQVELAIPSTRTVSGRLVGESGSLAQRVRFELAPTQNSAFTSAISPGPRYESEGNFTMTVPDGEYAVAVVGLPAGYRVKSMVQGSANLLQDGAMKVGPGETGDLIVTTDFVSPDPWVTVSGRVVGQTASKLNFVMRSTVVSRALAEVPIAGDGTFEIQRMAPGTYGFLLVPPITGVNEVRVVVEDRDVTGVEVAVPVIRDLSVRVEVAPSVVPPRPRLTLVSTVSRNSSVGLFLRPQSDGTFTAEVPEGEYRVVPTDVLPNYRVTALTFGIVDLLKDPLKIAGSDLPQLRIVFELVSSLPRVKVSGRIIGIENLGPAGSASIFLNGAGLSAGMDGTLDAQGRFAFDDVPSGTYTLRALTFRLPTSYVFQRLSGNTDEMRSIPGSANKTLFVADKDISDIELVVEPVTALYGRIQTENGLRLPEVFTFMLSNTSGRFFTYVRPAVRDTFTAVLLNGEYKLSLEGFPEGYTVKSIRQGAVDLTREMLKIGPQGSADEILITLSPSTP